MLGRNLLARAAITEPSAMPAVKIMSAMVPTLSEPPMRSLTIVGSSDKATAPTSQNQLVIKPPTHSRLSLFRSRSSAVVDVTGLRSIISVGSASPVDGMKRDEIQHSTAMPTDTPAISHTALPDDEAKAPPMVPIRMAANVAPSTSALPAGNSLVSRWTGRMPYLIGPNSAPMMP